MLYLHREVPTMPFSDADIRERAHALWEQAGRPEGQDFGIWIEAERQLIAEDQRQLQEPMAPEPARRLSSITPRWRPSLSPKRWPTRRRLLRILPR
jgi:hypothetical protein